MSKIEWTEKTWSPIVGCTKISDGCKNCFAEKFAYRLACMEIADIDRYYKYANVIDWKIEKWNNQIFFDDEKINQPCKWKKPSMIFVCSMSDLFYESVPFKLIYGVFLTIVKCPQHIFQILTKRPEQALKFFKYAEIKEPLNNLWVGATVESQKYIDRIKYLLYIPAKVRFLNIEPCLEFINLKKINGIDWIIVGCESGPKRRPCKIKWIESIAYKCWEANVPLFIKQMEINGKVEKDINKFPKHLRIREYPNIK